MVRSPARAATVALLLCQACTLIPRYAYEAETRVAPPTGAVLSEADVERAQAIAAAIAERCRLRSGDAWYESAGFGDKMSAMKEPPREFVCRYARKLAPMEIAISLTLELGEDTLYFTSADYERGEPSGYLNCMREQVKSQVAREFAGMSIEHEVEVIGPIYDRP